MQSLDDLRRIIRRIETRQRPGTEREPVERVVGGEVMDTGAGPLLVVRHEWPLHHRHGRIPLEGLAQVPMELLGRLARLDGPVPEPTRLLFLDTETTGLAGGTGTYAFLVGAGWREGDRFVVMQYFMRDLDEEPALLAALAPVLERASALVTFNGGGFDVPLLETRFVLGRRRWPALLPHLDLLRPARRVWAACYDDCRLATLERTVLGVAREADVPGGLIPTLYFDWLRLRRASPLARVFAHNRDDVLSLAALLSWFGGALGDTPTLSAGEWAGLARLWEDVDLERALFCYRTALERGLDGEHAHVVRLRLAWWEKRAARWDVACALWEVAARQAAFDPRPWEELAKFHEHRRRDFAAAHAVVSTALGLARASGVPPRVVDAFDYRLGRIERRLAAILDPASPGRDERRGESRRDPASPRRRDERWGGSRRDPASPGRDERWGVWGAISGPPT
ncbi:MAG TPA: ribonuclease H-like domain-containing protein [Methylomirabilota bacterium]|nr:ribonuclease H-like domain-containing protein [Methylomirabilota bacterium]